MSGTVWIKDYNGERSLDSDDFPLIVGSGSRVAIHLPGIVADCELAYVGLDKARGVFVQPGHDLNVFVNDTLLTSSTWLRDGDCIRIGAANINCHIAPQRWSFSVAPIIRETDAPPAIVVPPADSSITTDPVDNPSFVAKASTTALSYRKPMMGISLALFTLLVGVAWFVFTATSVSIRIEPTPDSVKLTGGILAFQVGERFLARPGEYTVIASKAGYRKIKKNVRIDHSENQSIRLDLEKLPGLLFVDTNPATDIDILVDDEAVKPLPSAFFELTPGTHTIHIKADRYADFKTDINIEGAGREQVLSVELVPEWASVTFASEPSGATLSIDKKEAGVTPISVDLLAGTHEVQAELDGYEIFDASVEVIAGEPQSIAPFELQKAAGRLNVVSNPSGASITINGNFRGRTPQDIALRPGKDYSIVLSKSGFEKTQRQITISSAEERKLNIDLTPKLGEVIVKSIPSGAKLYIDGKYRATTNTRVSLSTRSHQLEIKKPGFSLYRTSIKPLANIPQEIAVTLEEGNSVVGTQARPKVLKTAAGQELRLIKPGGEFTMGASRREQGRRSNETLRSVKLTRAVYIGVKEITNDEFRRFRPNHASGNVQRFTLDEDNLPAVNVAWEDAAAFCNWLSKTESLPVVYKDDGKEWRAVHPIPTGYRLPTEAEWSWAARYAGTGRPSKYPWGQSFPPGDVSGNYADSSATILVGNSLSDYNDQFPVTAPVGRFKANPLGLYDIGGNAAEWMHDYYTIYPVGDSELQSDPSGPEQGKHHVVRGSSWRQGTLSELRLSYRDYSDTKRPDLGFRIARYAEQK